MLCTTMQILVRQRHGCGSPPWPWRGEGGVGGYYKLVDTKKKAKQNKIEAQLKKRSGEKEEWGGYHDWLYRPVDKIMVVL